VAFALLWLLTLAWGLYRRRSAPAVDIARDDGAGVARAHHASLRRALHDGDLHGIEDALRAAAPKPAGDLAGVHRQLDDPSQRDAIDALQRARWGEGDPAAARAALRDAFAKGARWTGDPKDAGEPLPPLYPR
jgi:hypothetical protein